MAEGWDAVFTLLNKLSGVGFGTLLAIIIYGSWKNVWVWSRDVDKLTANYEKLLAKAEEQSKWWQDVAVRATGIAEMQGNVARELAKKTTDDKDKSRR